MKYNINEINDILKEASSKSLKISFITPPDHIISLDPDNYEGRIKNTLKKYLKVRKELKDVIDEEYRSIFNNAQKIGFDFLSKATCQTLPGPLKLFDEGTCSEISHEVLTIRSLHEYNTGGWIARVDVKSTSKSIEYDRITNRIFWQIDLDF